LKVVALLLYSCQLFPVTLGQTQSLKSVLLNALKLLSYMAIPVSSIIEIETAMRN